MERSFFSKRERLCGAQNVKSVFKQGNKYYCNGAKLFVLPNKLEYNRFLCTFPRGYGNAVQRNAARRLSKEVYRQMKKELNQGFDLILLLFPGNNTFAARTGQLKVLFNKAGLFSIN
ncbi:ribonuclease P protein component [Treponema phagedenis]|uniref:Ribonuclease P protein component n=1 Tax=Treponema phagedenis TaxID=162 RepID=A0AAE6ITB4_TREPH|nr:ribonuclease P protein component [Treponema phagedenis]EFW38654.1 ribonuclease P protein component [Treponema phagedenis F0421]NVP23290.1 ribonuclease P protein component [Treponema phagedenis]QEJ95377.1 ribonuclease P protein component [Treponema phagedenis]QEJ97910.1 ribonuclease P protein component [Treponema phagedenis]QEK01229.1 ribonuclease P protein component [Treponema phagedenis]